MNGASLPIKGEEVSWTPLVDVSRLPIADLLASEDRSPIARSVRRLQESLDDPNGIISAFSSYVSES